MKNHNCPNQTLEKSQEGQERPQIVIHYVTSKYAGLT